MNGWLEHLPSGWDTIQPRSRFRERREPSRPDDEHLTPSQHLGVLTQREYMERTGSRVVLNLSGADKMKHVEPGDFIAHLRSFQGGLETSALRGKVSTAYTVMRAIDGAHHPYFRWVFKSHAFIGELASTTQQLRDGQTVRFQDIGSLRLPLPPEPDQRRIADFLDDRVSRIDRIIAARNTQRGQVAAQAGQLIDHQLTDHGDRWGAVRLGRLLTKLEQGWSPAADQQPAELGQWGVMRAGCVNSGEFRAEDNKRLPDAVEPRLEYEIKGGDLIMSRASGSLDLIGSVALVPDSVRDQLLLCDKLYRLRTVAGLVPQYTAHALRHHANRQRIRQGVSGAEGMANNLPSGVIRSLMIPLPDRSTQIEAIDRWEDEMAGNRRTQAALTRSIELLTEYKQSLITAAVTGQLDVTTASTRIPE
ncbi:hypothetical protein I6I18_09105 [Kytococcus sedentarius]|uniref:Restriction endonuclease S subunit n=1 Tax=Kytococcus sedentarius (strain ATCC 14392 / DSM 20547 / JCM 11482 / CCUG 33030 / NBRC 15357 / NCTC 11040 / CCM 314 / 541) TaxID=478801 RepID=C7NM09_KYTSD|nr:hypothetical protein [Kytococcus sedentarius]ACV07258.1 hypothetical protein Ksed_22810 [Kytococcus sedentarius DSM 20547]QQB63224.1 hypothetical protein I6I18_09105 [Kytococcus sedentarius]STX13906.1 Type I restriction enzyme EcoKI specificity protein [Kytococcus sedentarius]